VNIQQLIAIQSAYRSISTCFRFIQATCERLTDKRMNIDISFIG